MSTIGEIYVVIKGDNTPLKKSVKESTSLIDDMMGTMGKGMAAGAIAAGALALAIKGIQFNAAAEQAQVSFGVMLGSADAARVALKQLKDYADKTPMQFKDVRDATQILLQFGLTINKAIPIMKMLGDVSGGDAQKLNSLALAFGQASSAGRLMGQELLQFINAGFNPLLEISKQTGESMRELKDRMAAGGISIAEVEGAFKRATSEGGQFYGMLDAQSKTLTGSFSTLTDAFDSFLGMATGALSKPITELFVELTKWLNNMAPVFQVVGFALSGIVKTLTMALKIFNVVTDSIKWIYDAGVKILETLGLVKQLGEEQNKNDETRIKNLEKIKDLTDPKNLQAGFEAERLRGQALQKLAIQQSKAREEELKGLAVLRDAGILNAKQYLESKMKVQQKVIDGITEEVKKTGQITEAQELEVEKRKAIMQSYADQIVAIDNNSQAAIEKRRAESFKVQEDLHKAFVLMVEESNASVLAETEANAAAQQKAAEDSLESWDGFYKSQQDSIKTNQEMAIQFMGILKGGFADAFTSLGEAIVKQQDVWGALGKAGIRAISGIIRAIGDQLTAMAAADTVKAIAALFSPLTAPFAPGLFAAAGIEAAGAAAAYTTAGIVGNSYAMGTDFVSTSGTKLVGEMGPELVQLPQGAKVFSNARTESILDKEKSISVVNNYYSPESINAVEADRLARRAAREMRLAF